MFKSIIVSVCTFSFFFVCHFKMLITINIKYASSIIVKLLAHGEKCRTLQRCIVYFSGQLKQSNIFEHKKWMLVRTVDLFCLNEMNPKSKWMSIKKTIKAKNCKSSWSKRYFLVGLARESAQSYAFCECVVCVCLRSRCKWRYAKWMNKCGWLSKCNAFNRNGVLLLCNCTRTIVIIPLKLRAMEWATPNRSNNNQINSTTSKMCSKNHTFYVC